MGRVIVEIEKVSHDPASTLLACYKLKDRWPICRIEEDAFIDLLTPAQFKRFEKGAFLFTLDKDALIDASKHTNR